MNTETKELLARLKGLYEKATQGDWIVSQKEDCEDVITTEGGTYLAQLWDGIDQGYMDSVPNARSIVALHNAFPTLVALIESQDRELERENERLNTENGNLSSVMHNEAFKYATAVRVAAQAEQERDTLKAENERLKRVLEGAKSALDEAGMEGNNTAHGYTASAAVHRENVKKWLRESEEALNRKENA